MAEPTTSVTAIGLAAGLAVFEATTGISPSLLAWGAVGGYWAFRYLPPMTVVERVSSLVIAALIAAICSIPLAAVTVAAARHFLAWWPAMVDGALLAKPLAATMGLLCHRVIGQKLIEVAERRADEVSK